MTERYAFRYTEYCVAQKEAQVLFNSNTAENENPLLADIAARFKGSVAGVGEVALAALGIRVAADNADLQALTADAPDYGADALRVAVLENNLPLTHNQKAAAWRLVDKMWQFLEQKPNLSNENLNAAQFYPFIGAVQKQDYKTAWFSLKTIFNQQPQNGAFIFALYPFMPHLVQSLYPDIHSKMPDFWQKINQIRLPDCYFIEVGGRFVTNFYPSDENDFEKIKKEALSFVPVQNKIKQKEIKKVIHIPRKGLNFVV